MTGWIALGSAAEETEIASASWLGEEEAYDDQLHMGCMRGCDGEERAVVWT